MLGFLLAACSCLSEAGPVSEKHSGNDLCRASRCRIIFNPKQEEQAGLSWGSVQAMTVRCKYKFSEVDNREKQVELSSAKLSSLS